MSSGRCLDPGEHGDRGTQYLRPILSDWELQKPGEKLRGKGRGRPRQYQGKCPSATLQPPLLQPHGR